MASGLQSLHPPHIRIEWKLKAFFLFSEAWQVSCSVGGPTFVVYAYCILCNPRHMPSCRGIGGEDEVLSNNREDQSQLVALLVLSVNHNMEIFAVLWPIQWDRKRVKLHYYFKVLVFEQFEIHGVTYCHWKSVVSAIFGMWKNKHYNKAHPIWKHRRLKT